MGGHAPLAPKGIRASAGQMGEWRWQWAWILGVYASQTRGGNRWKGWDMEILLEEELHTKGCGQV